MISFTDLLESEWHGDRSISTLTYLKGNWKQGGSTIFPNLNITIPMVEGNLLLWENLDKETLKPLKESMHKSCPVLFGPKVVLNKWIRSY